MKLACTSSLKFCCQLRNIFGAIFCSPVQCKWKRETRERDFGKLLFLQAWLDSLYSIQRTLQNCVAEYLAVHGYTVYELKYIHIHNNCYGHLNVRVWWKFNFLALFLSTVNRISCSAKLIPFRPYTTRCTKSERVRVLWLGSWLEEGGELQGRKEGTVENKEISFLQQWFSAFWRYHFRK